jgi:hypothetical protein
MIPMGIMNIQAIAATSTAKDITGMSFLSVIIMKVSMNMIVIIKTMITALSMSPITNILNMSMIVMGIIMNTIATGITMSTIAMSIIMGMIVMSIIMNMIIMSIIMNMSVIMSMIVMGITIDHMTMTAIKVRRAIPAHADPRVRKALRAFVVLKDAPAPSARKDLQVRRAREVNRGNVALKA